ncbi:MAG TPA: mechanosensitive ion channel domain-containing protein [Fimbriiglobus sp.]|jgi:small-conductance mechanosensitive channel
MPFFDDSTEKLNSFGPFLAVILAVFLGMAAARWLLLRRSLALDKDRRLSRQLILFGLVLIGIAAAILALPTSANTRNELLTVLGLLASGIIALSSTTIVANAMAGLMLRSTRSFRTGDFIRVGGHFGRVTERALLDTEIQTEDRELTSLPNLFLISNPVTVVRTSGTLVSTTLSLGYDIHHTVIEHLLLEAAKQAELDEPFVRVLDLGNYAVTYRVSGFLTDVKNLVTVRSNLCKEVLGSLHGRGIEIASPKIMIQRPLSPEGRLIPAAPVEFRTEDEPPAPEDIMFDKAERAERIEKLRIRLESDIADLEGRVRKTSGDALTEMKAKLDRRRKQLAALQAAPGKPSA